MRFSTLSAEKYCKFVTDGTHDSPKSQNTGRYLITSRHLRRYEIDFSSAKLISEQDYKKVIERSVVEKWDILFSMIGTIGNLYIETNDTTDYACKNMGIFKLGGDEKKSKWLYYYLQAPKIREYILTVSRGTTQGYVPLNALRSLPVEFPNDNERDKITNVLWNIDQKIKINTAINKNLEEQAQVIFAQYFIDIENIPDGWTEGNLTDIAEYLNGLAMQKFRPSNENESLPVLKIKELRQGICDTDSDRCSSEIKKAYIVHDGDVIFSWSGSLLVDFWCGGDCGLNQHLFKVTSEKYDKWFYYVWTNYHLQEFVKMAADRATTMGHIKRDALEKARVLIPNQEDYNYIGELLQPLYDSIIANRIENRKLSALRDTLLPRLMSGEIDVSSIEV